ncbi:hypothetical protein ACGRHY_17975 [Streptomyces sp. HK10]|uniref:hypothetical protein n=1 Tax=Streptomyces sp. HK10 TaxID=3373255 RepID=UPI003747A263
MSGWTPSQAEGERDDEEGIDQSRGLSERHEAAAKQAATEKGGPEKAAGAGEKGAEGTEQDRGGAR